MHGFMLALSTLRAPIFVALLTYVALTWPGQSLEVMRGLRESPHWWIDLIRAILGAGLLSFALTGCSLTMIYGAGLHSPRSPAVVQLRSTALRTHRAILETVAVLLALAPWVALAVLYATTIEPPEEKPSIAEFGGWFIVPIIITGSATALVAVAAIPMLARRQFVPSARKVLVGAITSWGFIRSRWIALHLPFLRPLWRMSGPAVAYWLFLTIAFTSLTIATFPVEVGNTTGPFLILFIFLSVLCLTLSVLTQFYIRMGIPIISVLLLLAFTFASFRLNDNHAVRSAPPNLNPPNTAVEEFKRWLQHRDIADFAGPYPVYIVAAEGGGLYAAAHVATTLALIQDNCDAFASHVFAISAVSGGSLGASVFAALLMSDNGQGGGCKLALDGKARKGRMHEAAIEFFQHDFLSPLLASLLFPDLLQRFLPLPNPAFDRGVALEASFDAAWRNVARKHAWARSESAFSSSHRALWNPTGNVPVLLFNTTLTSGKRVVLAPMLLNRYDEQGGHDHDALIDLLNDIQGGCGDIKYWLDLPLAAAVSLSARFPYVTPPATFVKKDVDYEPKRHCIPAGQTVHQVVDGGYFDNTGLQTAVQFIATIRSGLRSPSHLKKEVPDARRRAATCLPRNFASVPLAGGRNVDVCFKILIVGARNFDPQPGPYNEVMAPLMGVLSAREAQAIHLVEQVLDLNCEGGGCDTSSSSTLAPHASQAEMRSDALSLSWFFSHETLENSVLSDIDNLSCSVRSDPSRLRDELKRRAGCALLRIGLDLMVAANVGMTPQ